MSWLPDKQKLMNVPIQSVEYGKKKLFELREDDNVPEVIGDVFYPKSKTRKRVDVLTKILIFTTAKSAKSAVPHSKFYSGNKSQHCPYFLKMAQTALEGRGVGTKDRTNHHIFRSIFSSNHDLPQSKLTARDQNHSVHKLNVLSSHWLKN